MVVHWADATVEQWAASTGPQRAGTTAEMTVAHSVLRSAAWSAVLRVASRETQSAVHWAVSSAEQSVALSVFLRAGSMVAWTAARLVSRRVGPKVGKTAVTSE